MTSSIAIFNILPSNFFSMLSRKIIALFCLALFNSASLIAQTRCSAVEADKLRRQLLPHLHSEQDFERWFTKKKQEQRNRIIPFGTNEEPALMQIPVVVHVVHWGEPLGAGGNISDEQIYSQIEVLNEDFQRKNADTVKTQEEFKSYAGRMSVEFVLARQTEAGEPTTGIVRVKGPKPYYDIIYQDRQALSATSHWNPEIYLNIWVTNLRSDYLGFAQFPDYEYPGLGDQPNADNPATDGVVVDYKVFGSSAKFPISSLDAPYNLGRTTTHEVGHFFGLRHVWGDVTTSCQGSDYVDDTPPSNRNYTGLCIPINHESCNTNDMYENFLYYTLDACMNTFSKGQTERMQLIMENAPRRFTLINSIGTQYPGAKFTDIELSNILSPGKVTCSNMITPIISVRNSGTEPISSFKVSFQLNDNNYSIDYSGDTLFPGRYTEVNLMNSEVQGTSYFRAEISGVEGELNLGNNIRELFFITDNQKEMVPFYQAFEVNNLGETNWLSLNEDNAIGWEIDPTPMPGKTNSSAFINLYDYKDTRQVDWLISPDLDLTGITEATLVFKYSYAKIYDFPDQLYLMASDNCGNSFDYLIKLYDSEELVVIHSDQYWKPEKQSEWRTDSIDMSELAGKEHVRIAFMTLNGYGNNLYIDDIEFYNSSPLNIIGVDESDFLLFPNPLNNNIVNMAFNTSQRQTVNISIIDASGREVMKQKFPNTLNQTYSVDLEGIQPGVYMIVAYGEDFTRTNKLVKSN